MVLLFAAAPELQHIQHVRANPAIIIMLSLLILLGKHSSEMYLLFCVTCVLSVSQRETERENYRE